MVNIERLNHSGFLIKSGTKNIAVDPYKIDSGFKADIILITHPHFDHYSPSDIKRIKKRGSVVLMPPMNNSKVGVCKPINLRSWSELNIGDISIKAVPSYNLDKSYHPKTNGWLGYIIYVDGERIYHAGDTDFIDEMSYLGPIDYAMLPVSGKYTMDAKEAAEAARVINPRLAIPMHYGELIGGVNCAEEFSKLCPCQVRIN